MDTKLFIEKLKFMVERSLPGESAHIPMAPINRPISSFALKKTDNFLESAVSIVLFHEEISGLIQCVLIQRPDYEGAHGGQISFPGGKRDSTDPDAEYTARRECFEEIGCQLTQDQLIGKLTNVFIPVSKFLVQPYLYFYIGETNFTPDEREVSEILTFPIHTLIDEKSISTMDIRISDNSVMRSVPCFVFEHKKVWGATALILNELREVLLKIN